MREAECCRITQICNAVVKCKELNGRSKLMPRRFLDSVAKNTVGH